MDCRQKKLLDGLLLFYKGRFILNLDNHFKNLAGLATKEAVAVLLDYISNIDGVNITVNRGYKIGYPNYEKQFPMEFEIIFNDFDDEKWLIAPTSTIRTDRVHKVEFYANHIRLLDYSVTNIYVVTPDTLSRTEIKAISNYSKKIHSGKYLSFLTDIISIFDLGNKILYKATSKIKTAQRSNILGKFAEEYVVYLLNDHDNLLLWNDYDSFSKTTKSFTFDKYKLILESFGLIQGKDKIFSIYASTNIPKLTNNGLPKTDIATYITLSNTAFIVKKISVKNTDKNEVSVHQGDVKDIIQAIETSLGVTISTSLKNALDDQQKYGGIKDVEKYAKVSYDTLIAELPKYNNELVAFAIFGDNSPRIVDSKQIADIILYYRNFQSFDKHTYIDKYIKEFADKGQYGTPFKWTFQKSSDKGKSIQLKGFTNNKK